MWRILGLVALIAPESATAQDIGFNDPDYTTAMMARDGVVTLLALCAAAAFLVSLDRLLKRFVGGEEAKRPLRYGLLAVGVIFTAVMLVIFIPFSNANRSALMSMLGYVLSAVIALASATVAANFVAGVLLRNVWRLKLGDFLRVGDQFGRVTRLDAMRLRMTREDGGVVVYPASYLITHPFEHHEADKLLAIANVSLGFDVDRRRVEALLLAAAEAADLLGPTVRVREIGDFSIGYSVAGRLAANDSIFEARSRLNGAVLDSLHNAEIEIASPSLVSIRRYDPSMTFRPTR